MTGNPLPMEQIVPLDNFGDPSPAFGANLATGASSILGISGSSLLSSNQLPHGTGWGPGDITLRPVMSPDMILNNQTRIGDPTYDDYARLLFGRRVPEGFTTTPNTSLAPLVSETSYGRYGGFEQATPGFLPGAGVNYVEPSAPQTLDPLSTFKFYEYPQYDRRVAGRVLANPASTVTELAVMNFFAATQPSGYASSPDLRGRYAMPGLSYGGQPNAESHNDAALPSLVADSPYELNVMKNARRGPPQATSLTQNDDAPFSAAELERVLRAYDADANRLPDRLWNLVDAFDPAKLVVQQIDIDPYDGFTAAVNSGNRFVAQLEASQRRRSVTTDSREVPVATENWNARLVYGADGRPGAGGVDENGNWDGSVAGAGNLDEVAEYNVYNGNLIDVDGDGVISPAEAPNAVQAFLGPNGDPRRGGIDDYFVVMGADPPVNARLMDFLRYRVVLELKRKQVVLASGTSIVNVLPDADRAAVAGGAFPFSREDLDEVDFRINAVLYGNNATANSNVRGSLANPLLASYGGLIAPELAAGLKMDLNRPFGDGRDNNGNGVVDEPSEAGEPWVDVDGNGVWDGEPFLDLDGDGRFYADVNNNGFVHSEANPDIGDLADFDNDGIAEPAVDSLFARQLLTPVPFSHVAGVDANGRGAVTDAGNVIHDDGRMARQLYARHLYCLMLAVMDENYLAPFDPLDPQVMRYLDADSVARGPAPDFDEVKSVAAQIKDDLVAIRGLTDDDASAEARRQALRKLTCRKIAQWAINCADIRDSDAICTPFEYDENPWDGWNVVDTEHGAVYPIDGDLSTDENRQFSRRIDNSGWSAPDRYDTTGAILPTDQVIPAYDQTCGVVWGLERPELLLTEGLALHDRRVEDLLGPGDEGDLGDTGALNGQQIATATGLQKNDNDLDQRLRPRGSAFIEVFNPWSDSSHRPAELYRNRFNLPRYADLDKVRVANGGTDENDDRVPDILDANTIPVEGVILDRLSNGVAPILDENGNQRTDPNTNDPLFGPSPVWRMVCVEEHPDIRNDDPYDQPIGDGASAYPERDVNQLLQRPAGIPRTPGVGGPAGVMSSTDIDLLGGNANAFDQNQLPLDWHKPATRNFVETWRVDNRKEVAQPFRLTNPDFPAFDPYAVPTMARSSDATSGNRVVYIKPGSHIEREWYFTRGLDIPVERNIRNTDGIPRIDPADVRMCIPVRPIVLERGAGIVPQTNNAERLQYWPDFVKTKSPPGATPRDLEIYPWRFPPVVENKETSVRDFTSLRIAPLLPGHYAVVGSAGTQYGTDAGVLPQFEGRYVTTIGRTILDPASKSLHPFTEASNGGTIEESVKEGRRIELVPHQNPFLHQVAVAMNGGDESRLLRPVTPPSGGEAYVFNVTDPSSYPTDLNDIGNSRVAQSLKEFNEEATGRGGEALKPFYSDANNFNAGFQMDPNEADETRYYAIKPAIAVPIEGMNISEPLDSYFLRKAELENKNPPALALEWDRKAESGEGQYDFTTQTGETGSPGYDEPFDIQPELATNHTTPNYRSIHLQRLANPLLAWNPPPLRPDGTPHPQHDPTRTVNPYRTIDSMSLDLTAFNSINDHETRMLATGDRIDELKAVFNSGLPPEMLHTKAHHLPAHGSPLIGYATGGGDADKVLMTLSTQHRGFHEQIFTYGDQPPNNAAPPVEKTLRPGRLTWSQERANQVIDIIDDRVDVFDTRNSSTNPDGAIRVHEDLNPR
ncbi:MAG: hypothetical protein AAGF31_09925, partial [Planctomycetota bacterium]